MAMDRLEFTSRYIEASEEGDYVQVFFGRNRESVDEYLLIQRQFEFPDDGECYVETANLNFCGHYFIRSAQLARNSFRVSYGKKSGKQVMVTFKATDRAYAKAKRILKAIIPRLEVAEVEPNPPC